jgi:hypothetical protein
MNLVNALGTSTPQPQPEDDEVRAIACGTRPTGSMVGRPDRFAPDPHVTPVRTSNRHLAIRALRDSATATKIDRRAPGIGLGLVAFAAPVACFATGVCEAGLVLAAVGAGTFLVVMRILKSMGVDVQEEEGRQRLSTPVIRRTMTRPTPRYGEAVTKNGSVYRTEAPCPVMNCRLIRRPARCRPSR